MTRAERQKLEDLLAILALPAGQRFLAELVYGRCGLMRSAPLDALAMAYSEGRRAIGSELNEAVVNANRGAVPALLGTFLAEQDRARADIERDSRDAADGRERDEWGDPIPDRAYAIPGGSARDGLPDFPGRVVNAEPLPDNGSALG